MGLLVHTHGVNMRTDAPLPTLLKNPADVKCQIGWYFSKHNCIQSYLHELRLQTVSANTAAEHLLRVEQQEKLKPASTSLFTSVSFSCCHQQSACPFLQLTEDRFRRGETSQDPSPQKKVTPSSMTCFIHVCLCFLAGPHTFSFCASRLIFLWVVFHTFRNSWEMTDLLIKRTTRIQMWGNDKNLKLSC